MTNASNRAAQPRPASRTRVTVTITAVVLAVLAILFFVFSGFYADFLWFSQLGFLNVLTTQWIAGAVMFVIGFVAMAV
ncbi:MAG: uncharacterized protein QOI02_996, partial [Actinomycetota bacterium]|nr:uncharacterized protein [Actinomycetota bacterium]